MRRVRWDYQRACSDVKPVNFVAVTQMGLMCGRSSTPPATWNWNRGHEVSQELHHLFFRPFPPELLLAQDRFTLWVGFYLQSTKSNNSQFEAHQMAWHRRHDHSWPPLFSMIDFICKIRSNMGIRVSKWMHTHASYVVPSEKLGEK